MISYVRDAWAYGCHLPIYHSDYLFPYKPPSTIHSPSSASISYSYSSAPTDLEPADSNESRTKNNLIITVIRKIFDSAVRAYICPLYNWAPEGPDGVKTSHTVSWKSGGTLVIVIDIVTDRRKYKVRFFLNDKIRQ